jgi:methyl-accepting chemotaxis protein/hemerythrin
MRRTSVVRKTLLLSLITGIGMGMAFPLFTLLFVHFPTVRDLLLFWGACVLAGIGVGAISFWISRSTVIRFLYQMRDQIRRYQSGDAGREVNPLNEDSDDVLGEVARLTNQLVGAADVNLQDVYHKAADAYLIAGSLSESIDGALRMTQENKSKLIMFKAEMQEMVETVEKGYEHIRAIMNQADAAKEKIAEQAEAVEGSFRVADSLKQVTDELFASLEQRFNEIASAAEKVEESHGRILASREWIESVQERARNMHSIALAISEIAENTGILAINASIQAAHGGDSGKSFQVIAQEIRKLSDNSRNYSTEIQEQLGKNLELIDKTVSYFNESVEGSRELKQTLLASRESFESLRGLLADLQASDGEIQASVGRLRETQNLVVALQTSINNQILEIGTEMDELSRSSEAGGRSIAELSSYSSQLFREIMRISSGSRRASLSLEQGRLMFSALGLGGGEPGSPQVEARTIRWNPMLECGNPDGDALNRRRCEILDEMFSIIGGGETKDEIMSAIRRLIAELEGGFEAEERQFSVTESSPHADSHRNIIRELTDFAEAFRFIDEDQADLSQLPQVFGAWLLKHIPEFDAGR